MNILMIFGNNPLKVSGAVAFDLFNEFKTRGNNVKLLVNEYGKGYPDGVICMKTYCGVWKKRVTNKIKRTLGFKKKSLTDSRYHFHEIDEKKTFYKTSMLLKKAKINPDAIVILFAKNFINSKNIYELHKMTGKPIYWMMYDTSPLTGGCHYSWDCVGYQNSCGNCPGLFSKERFDITHQNLLHKKIYMDKTDISIVVASEWQYPQAKKSIVFKDKAIYKILISINPEIFKIVPKEICRNKLNISTIKKVIFFGAKGNYDERKGFRYLLEALKILKKLLAEKPGLSDRIHLLIAGEETDKLENELPFKYTNLGLLNNSYGVASAYQAADIYLCPSIEDAGPSMVNQSIMCGTPVVSFEQGVSLDLVITGKTGYLAKLKDSEDLAKGMYDILNMSEDKYWAMKMNCRNLAMELYSPDIIINKWLTIMKAS